MRKRWGKRERAAVLLAAALTAGLFSTACSLGSAEDDIAPDGAGIGADSGIGIPEAEEEGTEEDNEIYKGTASALGCLKSFSASTLDGGTFTQEDLKDKDVTIINFWSLTCGPCIVEMPDLAEFSKSLPENVQLLTVCLDGAGHQKSAEKILSQAGYEGITLISGEEDFLEVCRNLQYTPTTILVDADGNLVGDAIIGRQKNLSESFSEAVNEVLKAEGKEEITLEE